MSNDLICYEENSIKKWKMVNKDDTNSFLLELIQNKKVNPKSVFIIPTSFVSGIWLFPKFHKSNRVDFWNFFEDYGYNYKKPKLSDKSKRILKEVNNSKKVNTKYGFISPEGRYYHCDYQCHYNLADKICFGMVDTTNAEDYLTRHNWIKIYRPISGGSYAIYTHGKINDDQLKTLVKMELDKVDSISDFL